MSWTDERIATLKKMWKDGKSAAEIAKTLGKGVTRNAVIGKAHRMGLSGRPSPIKDKEESAAPAPVAKKEMARKSAPPPPAAKSAKDVKKSAPLAGPVRNPAQKMPSEPRPVYKDVIPPGGGVALLDLTERMCKWPIGDPRAPDFTFCGRDIRTGTPYCHEHASVAYQSSSRSRNAAQAVAANEDKEDLDEEVVEEEEEDSDDDEDEDDEDVA